MPDYKKKRINRFKPAPRRKRALPTDEDIKMTPADKRRKKSEKPEKTPEMPLRVVNGKKLERRRKTGIFFRCADYRTYSDCISAYFTGRNRRICGKSDFAYRQGLVSYKP